MYPLGTGNVISVFDELHAAIAELLEGNPTMLIDFDFDFDKGLGYYYNLEFSGDEIPRKGLNAKNFFLYGGNTNTPEKNLCTLYTYKGDFYLEASSLYNEEKDIEFTDWLNREYKIIDRIKLSIGICKDIKTKCETILKQISDFRWGIDP